MKAKLFLLFFLTFTSFTPAFSRSPIRSWATDMYNQPNIKPQEEGSMIMFPVGSVTMDGNEITSNGLENFAAGAQPWADFSPDGFRYNPSLTPSNPLEKSEDSVKNGKYLFNVYCVTCHGDDGKSATPVGKLRAAPGINGLVPKFSEGYLYIRITYGGNNLVSMPPFGYSTSKKERWEIVNYLKNTFK